eukprot:1635895-Amphidinium_carterae.1
MGVERRVELQQGQQSVICKYASHVSLGAIVVLECCPCRSELDTATHCCKLSKGVNRMQQNLHE